MTVRAVSIQPGSMSAEDFRLGLSAFLEPADILTARSGFVPGCVPTVTLTGGLGVRVPKFRAIIQGSSATNQGVYGVINDGDEDFNLEAGGTQDRIDLLVAWVRNDPYDVSGANDCRVTYVKGIEAASPVAPELPENALELGRQYVQAGASAASPLTAGNLTTITGPVMVGLGGIRPVSTLLGGTGDGFYSGQYRDNNGTLERWNGTDWVPYPPKVEALQTYVKATANGVSVTANANTVFPMDLVVRDTLGGADLAANPTRITIPTDGVYRCTGSLGLGAGSPNPNDKPTGMDQANTDWFWCQLRLNGDTPIGTIVKAFHSGSTGYNGCQTDVTLRLSAGDYLELVGAATWEAFYTVATQQWTQVETAIIVTEAVGSAT